MENNDDKVKKLIEEAKKASSNSYSPYSNFPVGAAVLTDTGNIYTGANIENASYGLTICAERVAVFNAVSKGERKIIYVALYSPKQEGIKPCGACLQVISEFATEETKIILVKKDNYEIISFSDLFPAPFSF